MSIVRRFNALDWRAARLTIIVVAVLVLLSGVGLILQNESTYRKAKAQETKVQAEILAASVSAALDFSDPQAAEDAVAAYQANRQARWVGVFDAEGRLVAELDRSAAIDVTDLAGLPPPGEGAVRGQAPVRSAGEVLGTVVIEVDREPISRRLTRYTLLALLTFLVALVVLISGLTQAALRRANREIGSRADALAQANALLEEQMAERARTQELLRQAQKMQALGQLTGGIAHDFNNLLTVIQGSADMLCRDNLPDDKRKRFAQAIVQASTTAAALTSQLLAFARRQPLKPERLDLGTLIADMGDLLDGTLGERVTLTTDLAEHACLVEVDRNQLQSAILNIASNARDAMPDGGELTIATRREEDAEGRPVIALSIRDTGTGMDAPMLERIFEPFFTTKAAGKGTGLGLSQVYGFASQSGGDATVDSVVGEGTVVTIILPCSAGEADGEPRRAGDRPAEARTATILIVEDNEEVGAFGEALLAELGHTVSRASSGEQALEMVRAREFDVVFSDVVMPGMGGLKLAETLAEEKPDLPVILATGYSPDLAMSGSGGRPVILKPYRLETVADAIAEALADR